MDKSDEVCTMSNGARMFCERMLEYPEEFFPSGVYGHFINKIQHDEVWFISGKDREALLEAYEGVREAFFTRTAVNVIIDHDFSMVASEFSARLDADTQLQKLQRQYAQQQYQNSSGILGVASNPYQNVLGSNPFTTVAKGLGDL